MCFHCCPFRKENRHLQFLQLAVRRAGISAEKFSVSSQREHPYGMLHNHYFGSCGKNCMSCYSVFNVLTLEVHWKPFQSKEEDFQIQDLHIWHVYIFDLLSLWLWYLNWTTQEKIYKRVCILPRFWFPEKRWHTVSLHKYWEMVTSPVLFWITSQFDKEE